MTTKVIAEVTYSFYQNTIRRDNNVQIVTSENEKSYYCQAIGTPFKKELLLSRINIIIKKQIS